MYKSELTTYLKMNLLYVYDIPTYKFENSFKYIN